MLFYRCVLEVLSIVHLLYVGGRFQSWLAKVAGDGKLPLLRNVSLRKSRATVRENDRIIVTPSRDGVRWADEDKNEAMASADNFCTVMHDVRGGGPGGGGSMIRSVLVLAQRFRPQFVPYGERSNHLVNHFEHGQVKQPIGCF